MDNHTVQFLVVRTSELVGIGEDGVERNDDITADRVLLCIVERDDISIVVVAQIFVVHLQDFVVVDEQIADFTDLFAIRFSDTTDPEGRLAFLDMWEFLFRRF